MGANRKQAQEWTHETRQLHEIGGTTFVSSHLSLLLSRPFAYLADNHLSWQDLQMAVWKIFATNDEFTR